MRIHILMSIFIGGCSAASFTCGDWKTSNFAQYDNNTKECVNGEIVPKTTTIPTTTLPSSTTDSTESTSAILRPPFKRMCELGIDLPEGYKCCGRYTPYLPEFETCCKMTQTKNLVHPGKPDKDYTCCRNDITRAYKRTDLPCAYHQANNDKFWKAPRVTALLTSALLTSHRLMKEACRTKTVYYGRVKIVNETSPVFSDLEIRLNKLDLKSPTLQWRNKTVNLYIEEDRHRQEPSKLHGKYFLIVTEQLQPTETPSYINVKNDAVYKLAKSRKRAIDKLQKIVQVVQESVRLSTGEISAAS